MRGCDLKASFTSAGTLLCAGMFLASCAGGGSTLNPPSSGTNVREQTQCATDWIASSASMLCRVSHEKSWMKKSSGALLYVSDIGAEAVDVFSYPQGTKVGTLTGFNEPNGLCADAKGNIFVTDTYSSKILEYAHGGTKPIATLEDAVNLPIGCAVDPLSGDLSVTEYTFPSQGTIDVYKGAKGTPTQYSSIYRTFFCTYDDRGNLFIDGLDNEGVAEIGELKKGSHEITGEHFGVKVGLPGGLSWDGKALVLGDQIANKYYPSQKYRNVAYQLKQTGLTFTLEKTIPFANGIDIVQFWLDGKTIIAPDASSENVGYYAYPKGGKSAQTITGFYEPVGATISQ
jgi:hypothetical protein